MASNRKANIVAELTPDLLPPLEQFSELAAAETLNGPTKLDRDTAIMYGQNLAAGIATVDGMMLERVGRLVADFDQDDFEQLFTEHLLNLPTYNSYSLVQKRAAALEMTVLQVIRAESVAKTDIRPTAADDIVKLVALNSDWLDRAFTPEQATILRDAAFSLTPEQVSRLLGVELGILAGWRHRLIGPPFTKGSTSRISVRYQAGLLVQWIHGGRDV